jgi:hypothetical protein
MLRWLGACTPADANRLESIWQKFTSCCCRFLFPLGPYSCTHTSGNLIPHSLPKRGFHLDALFFFMVYCGLKNPALPCSKILVVVSQLAALEILQCLVFVNCCPSARCARLTDLDISEMKSISLSRIYNDSYWFLKLSHCLLIHLRILNMSVCKAKQKL